jgi:hypothetical protein
VLKIWRHPGIRTITALLCAASFLVIPAHLASNGLGVLLLPGDERMEKTVGACPMCTAAKGGACHCPCCHGDACSCSLSSGDNGESGLLFLVLESALPPDQPEITPELPSAALFVDPATSLPANSPCVPTPPPRS